ncbi:MAG: IPExxxVDY family protein [Bacteroidales bacterium]|jgi:hypothetical protein|nr:IPExxxVDY family protein [Bacteroidales bacterium]HOI33588.1 IPExxxVDY family protein [Bacteroidales bacterium]
MPSRKKTLQSQPFDNIILLGISTTLPDYKLAWHINNRMSINLVKHQNIYPVSNDTNTGYSFYFFDQGENLNIFNLVSLSCEGQRWIKLSVSTDYLLIIRNALDQERLDYYIRAIRNIPQIVHVFIVETKINKGIDLLLETIEFHEMDIIKAHHQLLPKTKS